MAAADVLDGCDLIFDGWEATRDDEVDAVVMFADCWDSPSRVDGRRIDLIEWAEAAGRVVD